MIGKRASRGEAARVNPSVPGASYGGVRRKVKQPLRHSYPNLSPTRAPAVEADLALWPAWAKLPVEALDLDCFDDDGNPLFPLFEGRG